MIVILICALCALTLLIWWQEKHPAHNKVSDTGVVICLELGANDLHMVHLMPLPPRHLLLH